MNDATFLSVLRTKIGNLIKLSKGRSVFLYGAGHGGELCLKELTDSEICPEGFIDKKAGLMEDYCKLPVVSLNAITPENAFIIVSLLTYKSEIDTLLSKSGFLRDEDYVFVIDRNEKVNSCISVYDFSSTLTTLSKGSATVSSIVKKITRIPDSDLYAVAIDTNDVRYRDPLRCAMTAQEYVDKIDILRYGLKKKKPDCHFVFIAPWYSSDGDPYTSLTYDEKLILNKKYSEALLEYCKNNGDTYIDPNERIKRIIDKYPQKMYLVDHIHPNADYGVVLYSEAVMAYMTTAG
ncbi:SGNH/GDSL hydrolase family protein [Butyrivibrio sp.]|jgi:hypothetical protein|uniref:SGNH/GDSL hydrolase family protein n=1 Tax=Butyrivibrio sp. TaxID=28121 RepID=UPI0025C4E0CC|nr:SGNH/GDSL hydrolase family protein [Butyrivibrio sp.]MBE5837067.1 SGNH/GDSL hydrolase family protein [Butyrivibrio sp.]